MLDTESEEWRKRIELRKIDEFQKAMRWFVLVVFLMNWYTWFLLISWHWGDDVEPCGGGGAAFIVSGALYPDVFQARGLSAYRGVLHVYPSWFGLGSCCWPVTGKQLCE